MLVQLGAKGFRPYFLVAGLGAAVLAPLWMWAFLGGASPSGVLQGVVWHGHEMVYGFTMAVVAGFLLTAVENWTGRPTLRGAGLLLTVAVWITARIGLWFPGWLGPIADLAFLPLVTAGIAVPLWATGNRRNYGLVALLTGLWLANVAVFLDAAGWVPGAALPALRVSVQGVAVLILVIAGRVVPMFTRNATGDASLHATPWLDRLAIGATALFALLQLGFAPAPIEAGVAGVAGLATLGRMVGWWTPRLLSQPLLWVLHLGHAAVGLGLLLHALPALGVAVGTGPLHMITIGGIGMLTLGMMARVSLGHSGRPIQVGTPMAAAFLALAIAAAARVFGPWLDPARTTTWWWIAAGLWSAAFLTFVVLYARILVSPRADGKEG